MRVLWVLAAMVCLSAEPPARVDPKVISIYPFTGQRGSIFNATVRGSGLAGASSALVGKAPFHVTIAAVEPEPAGEASGKKKIPTDLVKVRVQVAEGAQPGRYPVRLVTPKGISNALPLEVVDLPVLMEPAGAHESPDTAMEVAALPALFAGRLARRGETDYYRFQAKAGQVLTFDLISGLPQTASGGSAATVPNFDPALSIYQAAGSWLDARRLKRVAFNDEPVWVSGKSTDAHLVQRFATPGTYFLRVEAFAGQAGPDYSYELKIAPGALPEPLTPAAPAWEERTWTRRLDPGRLHQLALRGGKSGNEQSIETYRGAPAAVSFKIPGTIEGTLAHPGEAHHARFHLDGPADIAIEVETPAAAPPFFNPVVRLLDASGAEVATNVFADLGACSGAMTKSLESKTIVPLRNAGDYTLEIRDATADLAGPDFRYRVQVRPQVPHVGNVQVDTDHVNLTPGQAQTIRVVFDREEDFRGAVAVAAESLPPGVTAAAGADFEAAKDGSPGPGKRERYTPRTERIVVVLSASAEAPVSSEPREARLVIRPVVDGHPGEVLATKSFPMMTVSGKP